MLCMLLVVHALIYNTLVKGTSEMKSARQDLMATTYGIAIVMPCNQNDHKICENRFFVTSLVPIHRANSSLL